MLVVNPKDGTVEESRFEKKKCDPTRNSGSAVTGITQAKFSAVVLGS